MPDSRLPAVTVILPVYNAGPHLAEAVDSILNQSYPEFELIAVNDGSTDGSGDYLDRLHDPRVRVVHQANQGLVAALNRGLSESTHDLVARMDSDDISAPDRLRRQASALVTRSELAAVATCYELIDEAGIHVGEVHLPADPEYLVRQLYFRNALPHGGMMFRKHAVQEVGGYRPVGPAEDYDLWTRLALPHRIGSLPETLFRYRVTATGTSQTSARRQRAATRHIRAELHAHHPLRVPSPWRLAADGMRIARAQQHCPGLAASYLFDHVGLVMQLLRARRNLAALRLALGVTLFALRRPPAVTGLMLFRHRRPGPPTQQKGRLPG